MADYTIQVDKLQLDGNTKEPIVQASAIDLVKLFVRFLFLIHERVDKNIHIVLLQIRRGFDIQRRVRYGVV